MGSMEVELEASPGMEHKQGPPSPGSGEAPEKTASKQFCDKCVMTTDLSGDSSSSRPSSVRSRCGDQLPGVPCAGTNGKAPVRTPVAGRGGEESELLQRIFRHPLFKGLQGALAADCCYSKIPYTLLSLAQPPGQPHSETSSFKSVYQTITEVVVKKHTALCKLFVTLRAYQTEDSLELERRYSNATENLEMDRYKALAFNCMSDSCKNAINQYYDKERIHLIDRVSVSMELFKDKAMEDRRRGIFVGSPHVSPRERRANEEQMEATCTRGGSLQRAANMDGAGCSCVSVESPPSCGDVEDTSQAEVLREGSDKPDSPLDLSSRAVRRKVRYENRTGIHPQGRIPSCSSDDSSSGGGLPGGKPLSGSGLSMESQMACRRTRFLSKKSIAVLQSWYDHNKVHPYPTDKQVDMLAKAGAITAGQVKKWMANTRARSSNTLAHNGCKYMLVTKSALKKRMLSKYTLENTERDISSPGLNGDPTSVDFSGYEPRPSRSLDNMVGVCKSEAEELEDSAKRHKTGLLRDGSHDNVDPGIWGPPQTDNYGCVSSGLARGGLGGSRDGPGTDPQFHQRRQASATVGCGGSSSRSLDQVVERCRNIQKSKGGCNSSAPAGSSSYKVPPCQQLEEIAKAKLSEYSRSVPGKMGECSDESEEGSDELTPGRGNWAGGEYLCYDEEENTESSAPDNNNVAIGGMPSTGGMASTGLLHSGKTSLESLKEVVSSVSSGGLPSTNEAASINGFLSRSRVVPGPSSEPSLSRQRSWSDEDFMSENDMDSPEDGVPVDYTQSPSLGMSGLDSLQSMAGPSSGHLHMSSPSSSSSWAVASKRYLSPSARQILNEWFTAHIKRPYPTQEEKTELAARCSISTAKVDTWFANKRNRTHNTRKLLPKYSHRLLKPQAV